MTIQLLLHDDFSENMSAGKVDGSYANSGQKRYCTDIENIISIDNGALRIAPLIESGFKRASLSYGPFAMRPGLAFSVNMLNGHNTSQAEPLPGTLFKRLKRWFIGSETDSLLYRISALICSKRFNLVVRKFLWWLRLSNIKKGITRLDENLVIGWFADKIVTDPRADGSSFIMHALGPENGELWTGRLSHLSKPIRGVQNIPIYYIAVIRENGTVFYISSIPDVPGFSNYPYFIPIAIDHVNHPENLYLGLHQGVLGQIGFRVDSLVRNVQIGQLEGYDSIFGGAHAADSFYSKISIEEKTAEIGGDWSISRNFNFQCETFATLAPSEPSGLIHATVLLNKSNICKVGIVWRFKDNENHWKLLLSSDKCELIRVIKNKISIVTQKKLHSKPSNNEYCLQIFDSGNHIMAFLDGEALSTRWISCQIFEKMSKVGIIYTNKKDIFINFKSFEAHPRFVSFNHLFNMFSPWYRKGSELIISDNFDGVPGDIEGRITSFGNKRWTRLIGKGNIEIDGNGSARVKANVESPCPGRTAYCIDWLFQDFVDLNVTITPPGTRRGQNHKSRSGFVIYQDKNNYICLNFWLHDNYDGASISTFFKLNGFEDLYDAIWTNVGNRINYGHPSRLRLCCDGKQYLAFIDEEPVLYRKLSDVYPDVSRITISKIGLVSNWEWGCDTGSRFNDFKVFI